MKNVYQTSRWKYRKKIGYTNLEFRMVWAELKCSELAYKWYLKAMRLDKISQGVSIKTKPRIEPWHTLEALPTTGSGSLLWVPTHSRNPLFPRLPGHNDDTVYYCQCYLIRLSFQADGFTS